MTNNTTLLLQTLVIALCVLLAITLIKLPVANNHRPVNIDGDKVNISYNYNYERLSKSKCETDYECEIAQIIADYRTGVLNYETQVCSEPVFEPTSTEK